MQTSPAVNFEVWARWNSFASSPILQSDSVVHWLRTSAAPSCPTSLTHGPCLLSSSIRLPLSGCLFELRWLEMRHWGLLPMTVTMTVVILWQGIDRVHTVFYRSHNAPLHYSLLRSAFVNPQPNCLRRSRDRREGMAAIFYVRANTRWRSFAKSRKIRRNVRREGAPLGPAGKFPHSHWSYIFVHTLLENF